MKFSEAFDLLESGEIITRKDLNGSFIFRNNAVSIYDSSMHQLNRMPSAVQRVLRNKTSKVLSEVETWDDLHFAKTTDDLELQATFILVNGYTMQVWIPSVSDLTAYDWELFEN